MLVLSCGDENASELLSSDGEENGSELLSFSGEEKPKAPSSYCRSNKSSQPRKLLSGMQYSLGICYRSRTGRKPIPETGNGDGAGCLLQSREEGKRTF